MNFIGPFHVILQQDNKEYALPNIYTYMKKRRMPWNQCCQISDYPDYLAMVN